MCFSEVLNSSGKWMMSWWRMLFPLTCVICADVLTEGEQFICSGCLSRAPLNEGEEDDLQGELLEDMQVDNLYWLFHYDHKSEYHKWIYAIKYLFNKELGAWSGRMLGERMSLEDTIDRVIPVPLHPDRERERGFNQAFVIGTGIADMLGVELRNDVLRRVVNTRSQTGLNREERTDNVKNAFCLVNGEGLQGLHLLLVDDVVTTGATIRSCVEVLREIPGVRVSVASLGKAGGL